MKVGVNLLNFGPGTTPASLLRWTRLIEGLGYHLLMISDHVAITSDVATRYPAPFYDPFVSLAWLAGITRDLELGTTVIILPYRHPLATARQAANIDALSGGRFILGVGVGWAREEFAALGIPFVTRGAMSDEYLSVIRACWSQEVASYDGRFVSFSNVGTAPRPVRAPHLPIWVGGHSDAALRRTVLHGDAWHPIRIRLEWLTKTGLPRLREIADREGRPVPALCPRIKLRLTEAPVPEGERLIGEGSLDQIRADLHALESLGAPYVLLDTYLDDPEATRQPEPAWRTLATMAERVLDLARQSLR